MIKRKYTTKNSFLVPHDTFENPKFLRLSPSCQLIYVILCKIHNRIRFDNEDITTHWFHHSLEQLADKSKLSIKTIIEAKKSLNENKFIDIQKGYYVNGRLKSSDYFRLNGFRMKENEKTEFKDYQ